MSFELRGADQLLKKLGKMERVLDTFEPAVQRSILRLQADMAHYPPQNPGSSYVRTGKLGQSWSTRILREPNSLRGVAGSNIHYAPRVQSKAQQERPFRGRWQTEVDVLNKNRKGIILDLEQVTKDVIR